jgi:hypothetical protein
MGLSIYQLNENRWCDSRMPHGSLGALIEVPRGGLGAFLWSLIDF